MRIALGVAVAGWLVISRAPVVRADADLTIDLSAGAGADTGETTTSFGALRAAVTAELYRRAPPPDARGISLGASELSADPAASVGPGFDHVEPGFSDRAWIFTGLDPNDRDTIGVTGEATAHVDGNGETDDALLVAGRGWARFAGWQLEAHGSYQPVGDLRDVIWRSGRGVAATGLAIDVPGMWALGGGTTRLEFGRFRLEGGTRSGSGFDRGLGITGAKLWSERLDLDIISLKLFEYGVVERVAGDIEYGTSAAGADIDVLAGTLRLPAGLELVGRAGFAIRAPVAAYMQQGNTQTTDGPAPLAGTVWFEVRRGLLPDATGPKISVGGGTWSRIDPTGLAVDSGGLGTIALAVTRGRFDGRLDAQLGRFQRTATSPLAPTSTAPVGTRMWMGRGALALAVRLDHDLSVSAGVWIEQSDRDDPRWRLPATGAVTTHAGAELAAAWRFSR